MIASTQLTEYVQVRVQQILRSGSYPLVESQRRYGPTGLIGVAFRVGPLRAIYTKSNNTLSFYDGDELVCADYLALSDAVQNEPGREEPDGADCVMHGQR